MDQDQRRRLTLASSRRMSVLRGGLDDVHDPADEPLASGTPRPALTSISVRRSGLTLTATTSLALTGRVLSGSATCTDDDRELAIARATLDALRPLLPGPADVDSATIVSVPGRKVALTVIAFPDEPAPYQLLVGSALVRGDVEDALARSVLSALNRRLDS